MNESSNTPTTLEQLNALIGKKLYAYAWQYDNNGFVRGIVTRIEPAKYGDKMVVFVDPSENMSASSWEFTPWQIATLLTKGEFDTQGWNSGTNAYVK